MLSFLGTKKNRDAWGDLEGTMHPVFRCSLTNALQVSISRRFKGYTLVIFGTKLGFRSMA